MAPPHRARYYYSFLLLIHAIVSGSCEDPRIPPCDQNAFRFETDLSQADCKKNTYLTEKSVVGCFPSCIKKLGYGVPCTSDPPTPNKECAPGLKCVFDEELDYICDLDKESCLHYNFLIGNDMFAHEPLWTPKCLPNGDFAPVQCKGEVPTGRCFCYNEKGKRIFGQQWWRKADKMTCECSRKRAKLIEAGRTDVTLHCDPEGNYEPLQCDSGMCWCADPSTGDITASVVPEAIMEKLPCYDESKTGSKYLRQCESQAIAQARILLELREHGTMSAAMENINCDPDGSYGNVQTEKGITFCSWRDKTRIKSWQVEAGSQALKLDCYCARDFKMYEIEALPITFDCAVNGNYEPTQKVGQQYYCVDSDGFPISDLLPEGEIPDCAGWLYEKQS